MHIMRKHFYTCCLKTVTKILLESCSVSERSSDRDLLLRQRAARLFLSGYVSASGRTGSSGLVKSQCARQFLVTDTERDSAQHPVCNWSDLCSDQLDTLLPPSECTAAVCWVMLQLQVMKMLCPIPACTARPREVLAGCPLYPPCH